MSSPTPFRAPIVRVFSNPPISSLDRHHIETGFRSVDSKSQLIFDKSGRADLAVVINYTYGLKFAYGNRLRTAKWLMEPTIYKHVTHLFTHRHSRIFDFVFAHNILHESNTFRRTPPLVPPHVPVLNPEELVTRKNKLVSAVGSHESLLPLHRSRSKFLDALEADSGSGVEVFGKGRRYVENKLDGLQDFMYSIAIENSSTPDYWTEKISDCFLSMCIPIYLGAPNIEDYFPGDSMIRITPDDLENGLSRVLPNLSPEDYFRRLDSLAEARRLVLEKHNLGVSLARLASELSSSDLKARRIVRLWTLDTFVYIVVKQLSRLPQPIRRILSKLRTAIFGFKSQT